MAASAKQLAITLCMIGLMAGSACATSETLDREEQEFGHVSNRRLLLPRLYNIYHPAPPPSPAPASYAPSPAAAPAPYAPAAPTANYAEPASRATEEANVAPPAPPSSIKFDTTPFEEPNRGERTERLVSIKQEMACILSLRKTNVSSISITHENC